MGKVRKVFQIRDIDPSIHLKIKLLAVSKDIPVHKIVEECVRIGLDKIDLEKLKRN